VRRLPTYRSGVRRRRGHQRRRIFFPGGAIYFIKGNNEDSTVIAAAMKATAGAERCHYLPNGGPHVVGRGASPRSAARFRASWYNTPAASLPGLEGPQGVGRVAQAGQRAADDKRRHFGPDEVMACKALSNIDLFLTHEAPRPFYPAGRRIDAEKPC